MATEIHPIGKLIRCSTCNAPIGTSADGEFIVRLAGKSGRMQEMRARPSATVSVSCERGHLNVVSVTSEGK